MFLIKKNKNITIMQMKKKIYMKKEIKQTLLQKK